MHAALLLLLCLPHLRHGRSFARLAKRRTCTYATCTWLEP